MSPNQGAVYAVAVVLAGVATIAVGLRIYIRKSRQIGIGSDDWTVIAALVCYP